MKSTKQPTCKLANNNSTTKPKILHAHVDNEIEHAAITSTKKEIKFQNATLLKFVTTIVANKKHTNHREEKNNDLQKLMIESLTQENGTMEFGLNFPTSFTTLFDAPPSFLMDLTTSPKVKTMEEGVEVHCLVRNTLRVEGHVGALGLGLRRLTSNSITHTDLHKPNNKLVSA